MRRQLLKDTWLHLFVILIPAGYLDNTEFSALQFYPFSVERISLEFPSFAQFQRFLHWFSLY